VYKINGDGTLTRDKVIQLSGGAYSLAFIKTSAVTGVVYIAQTNGIARLDWNNSNGTNTHTLASWFYSLNAGVGEPVLAADPNNGLNVYYGVSGPSGNSGTVKQLLTFGRSTGSTTANQLVLQDTLSNTPVSNLALSPDGTRLYASDQDGGTISIYDRGGISGLLSFVHQYGGHPNARQLAVSSDSRFVYLASFGDDSLYVENAIPTDSGSTAGLGLTQELFNGQAKSHFDFGLAGSNGVRFSADGGRVFVTSASSGTVVEFRRSTADVFMVFDHVETGTGLGDVSASAAVGGQFLFTSATSLTAFVPDTDGTFPVDSRQQFTDGVLAATFGLTDLHLIGSTSNAVFAYSPADSELAVFQWSNGQLTLLQLLKDDFGGIDGLQGVNAAALSPDGNFLYALSASQHTLTMFSLGADGRLTPVSTASVPGVTTAVLVAPDGSRLFTVEASGHIRTYTRNSGTGALTLVRDSGSGVSNDRAVVAPDGQSLLLLDSGDDRIRVVAVAADGTLILGPAIVNGQNGVTGLNGPTAAAFSPDGKSAYVTGHDGNALVVFSRDTNTGQLTFVQSVANGVAGVSGLGGANAVAVSADGKFVFAGGAADGTLAVFGRNTDPTSPDFSKLTFAQRLRDQSGGVSGLAGVNGLLIGPGGNLFASGSGAGLQPANVGAFSVNTAAPPPAVYQVGYEALSRLDVTTADENDSVSVIVVTTP
jgi:6-phosphogluconolactonase (cycloisomerase 2 family)